MLQLDFYKDKDILSRQYEDIKWISESGLCAEELCALCDKLTASDLPRCIAKAKTIELILTQGRLAIDERDIFQDKICGSGIIMKQRWQWQDAAIERELSDLSSLMRLGNDASFGRGNPDYGHLTPDTAYLCRYGLGGVLENIKKARAENTNPECNDLYESLEMTWEAIKAAAIRLSEAVREVNPDNAQCLLSISEGSPKNTYEVLQLLYLYFALHEITLCDRVRTLGRLDVILTPFIHRDLEENTFTESEIREMLRYILFKMYSAKIPFGLPFTIGGKAADGVGEVTCDVTEMIADVYAELSIYSPKIHVRISDTTPDSFTKKILDHVRHGSTSFLLMNDTVAVEGLTKVGISEKDAFNYVPVGCYENAVWGKELPCTGNAYLILPKALELVRYRGVDKTTGRQLGIDTGSADELTSFESVVLSVKKQLSAYTEKILDFVRGVEALYGEINPDPITTGLCESAVKRGVDIFQGSATYNNSSLNFMGLATLADSLYAIKKLVFEDKKVTLPELFDILDRNWEGSNDLRQEAKRLCKYGNGIAQTDNIARELSDFAAELVNNKTNGRGGVFKAGMFSIDYCFLRCKSLDATPDGRASGEPFSKNLSPTLGCDKNGVTGLIKSASAINHTLFSNGTVLDYVLHPSAVTGEDGLSAMLGLVKAYFANGGLAIHGNVLNPDTLKKAQKNPEAYKTLQIRVCGWSVPFNNLTKIEQDAFIRQAENS